LVRRNNQANRAISQGPGSLGLWSESTGAQTAGFRWCNGRLQCRPAGGQRLGASGITSNIEG